MDQENFAQDLEAMVKQIENSDTEKLSELAKITGLDLAKEFVSVDFNGENLRSPNLTDADLQKANLTGANLMGADLTGTILNRVKVENTEFGYNPGINKELRREFEARGAIFVDSPEDL